MIKIALINRTSRIRDAVFATRLAAFQAQITEDFCPAWGIDPVTISFVGKAEVPDPALWKVWLLDNSDQADALGYHEDETGVPESKIFVEDDMKYGSEISVTISHELLEMLADPKIDRVGPTIDGLQYMVEVGDPVEADLDGPQHGGVRLSNFVLPPYYVPGSAGPWDFMGLLKGPCPDMRPGGYLAWRRVSTGEWGSSMMRYEDGTFSQRATKVQGRGARRALAQPAPISQAGAQQP